MAYPSSRQDPGRLRWLRPKRCNAASAIRVCGAGRIYLLQSEPQKSHPGGREKRVLIAVRLVNIGKPTQKDERSVISCQIDSGSRTLSCAVLPTGDGGRTFGPKGSSLDH